MKGWVLDKEEKECADWIITNFFKYDKLDCWDLKVPDGYISEFEKGLMYPEEQK